MIQSVKRNKTKTAFLVVIIFMSLTCMVVYAELIRALKFFFSNTTSAAMDWILARPDSKNARLQILQSTNVSALVFYGRKRFVEILNCYLEKNLIENGGILSEVIFLAKTSDVDDLKYLDQLIAAHPERYFRKNVTDLRWTFETHYQSVNPERYYFKIDDDIVYIHPNAFESMLKAKLANSDVLYVSANMINHPVLASVHAQMRAIHNIRVLANMSRGNAHCDWRSSNYGAIQHESFVDGFYKNTLHSYMFSLWDFNWNGIYPRWSINLILFQGKYVMGIKPGDDEH